MSKKSKSVRFVVEDAPSDEALLRMSKRRKYDNDGEDEGGAYGDIGQILEPRPGQNPDVGASVHTLDSDEEEDEKYERLNVADVEGQEEATLEFDQETKITPFNMTEEMDEGHFDSDGTFIFNKKKEEIHDAWLDNIDWAKIKKDAGDLWQGQSTVGEDESSNTSIQVDRATVYTNILEFLKPRETITQALSRLGGSRSTKDIRKARWQEKKNSKPVCTADEANGNADQAKSTNDSATAVVKLTELVDSLVNEGVFEVYGYTYEKVKHELEALPNRKDVQEKKRADEPVPSTSADDESALDMFADEIDEKKLKEAQEGKKEDRRQEMEDAEKEEPTSTSSDVCWEFKWKNEDTAQTYGPCSSQQMQQWTDDGYFKDGVWVRRVGQQDGPFYSSKRIDFELYI